jgi:signal transduction histidine kinase
MLTHQAGKIAEQWEAQARSVALRESSDGVLVGHRSVAEGLVVSLAAALASDGATSEDTISLGLAFGTDAFEAGASLHHTLKALALLSAMVLYRVEGAMAWETAGDVGLADAMRLSRWLQQGASLLSLAVAKGYTQAVADGMRDNFRLLRHDLRNPLGTIKSILALMDDETIPVDKRANPRFRAMAKRNARALGELIADRLSDSEAVSPVLSCQTVSLRTVACSVRRDLRAEVTARAVTVLVAGAKALVRVDAVGLELMLYELLRAALQEAPEGDELSIDFGDGTEARAIVRMQSTPARPPIANRASLERLTALAAQMGGKLETKDCLVLSLPVQHMEASATAREVSRSLPIDASGYAAEALRQ